MRPSAAIAASASRLGASGCAAADDGVPAGVDRKPSWRAWWTPAFGLAAAAVLAACRRVSDCKRRVSHRANGLGGTNRLELAAGGRPRSEVEPKPAQPASIADQRSSLDAATLATHQPAPHGARVVHARDGHAAGVSDLRASGDTQIIRRVSDLVAQSETRQQQELALRIAQLIRDVDAQRVADLMRIQQGQGRIEAMTTAEAAAHRDLASYILTSSKQQQK